MTGPAPPGLTATGLFFELSWLIRVIRVAVAAKVGDKGTGRVGRAPVRVGEGGKGGTGVGP